MAFVGEGTYVWGEITTVDRQQSCSLTADVVHDVHYKILQGFRITMLYSSTLL